MLQQIDKLFSFDVQQKKILLSPCDHWTNKSCL